LVKFANLYPMGIERPLFDPKVELLKAAELLRNSKFIGLDADQVLIDSKIPVINSLNRILKTSYRPEVLDDWYVVSRIALKHGLSEEEALRLEHDLWIDPEVLADAPPCRGAIHLTMKLVDMGKELRVVTSRIAELTEVTYSWFAEWMRWIPQGSIKIRQKEDARSGEVFKADTVRELSLPVFVEDTDFHALLIQRLANAQLILVNEKEGLEELDSQRITRVPTIWDLVHALNA